LEAVKLLFVFTLINIFPHLLHATNSQTESLTEDSVYAVVEKMPEFTGGEAARIEFLKQNVRYPEEAQRSKKEGRVIVQFVIGSTGRVRNAKVVKSIAPSLDQEALRVVNSFPDWIPGEQNGIKVSVHKVMIIPFKYVPIQNDSTTWEVNEKTIIMLDDLKMPSNFYLALLNPERIASVNVLKPSPENEKSKLVAQYGELAENGVILIETKKKTNNLINIQDNVKAQQNSPENLIPPQFPGGMKKMFEYIDKNLKYPILAQKYAIEGVVNVLVSVSKDGTSTLSLAEEIDPYLDVEAIRLVQSFPRWIPAEVSGKRVDSFISVPVIFKLKYNSEERKALKITDEMLLYIDEKIMPKAFNLKNLALDKIASFSIVQPTGREIKKRLVEKYGAEAINGVVEIVSVRHELKPFFISNDMPLSNNTTISNDTDTLSKDSILDEQPYTLVEKMPQFPGGENALLNFISKNLKYPIISMENGIKGMVVVRFVITKTGKVINVKALRSLDPYCDKEAIRVVRMLPDWIPAEQKGEKVSVYYTLPIFFKLQ
jgi:TonB family protein